MLDENQKKEITILLVDDEPIVLTSVELMLLHYGHQVLTAASGEQALRVARDHQGEIHVVISDVLMPGMDGIALVNKIRREHPNIPVVLISGYLDEHDLKEAPGDAVLLAKPFKASQLNDLVENLTGRNR